MSVEVDWEIVDEQAPWPEDKPPASPPSRRPRPPWLRRLVLALGLAPLLVLGVVAAFIAITYRRQTDQAAAPVKQVAQIEMQAAAAGDQDTFMAIQDPEDPNWRAVQDRNFGRLQRMGLPEYGWQPAGLPPELGSVSLEPGGALLNVTRQFSVTQPMPGGPVTVTLNLPEYFKRTPSGWVRAMPGSDFWGSQRTHPGTHLTVVYYQRDSDVIEPLIPQLEDLYNRTCDQLACPPRIMIVFDNAVNPRYGYSLGGGEGDLLTMRFSSPHLAAMPTDVASRSELARAIQMRLVRSLVYRATATRSFNRGAAQEIVRWELARVGLTGPYITDSLVREAAAQLRSGHGQSLDSISLAGGGSSGNAMMSLALAFLNRDLGTGTVERLMPALANSDTLGQAIQSGLGVNPAMLEPGWEAFLRDQGSVALQ